MRTSLCIDLCSYQMMRFFRSNRPAPSFYSHSSSSSYFFPLSIPIIIDYSVDIVLAPRNVPRGLLDANASLESAVHYASASC